MNKRTVFEQELLRGYICCSLKETLHLKENWRYITKFDYIYMYIWYHFIHNICWNVKNILYSNFMIIYRLCKVLSFTWSMTLSSTIWFWILKTFSQQLHDKLPTWKYILLFSTENKDTVKHVEMRKPDIILFHNAQKLPLRGTWVHPFLLASCCLIFSFLCNNL